MWICGTGSKKLRLPSQNDKGHGKGRGRSQEFWVDIIHTAIGDGLLSLHFTTIRASGLFRDQTSATLRLTDKGRQIKEQNLEWKVPCLRQEEEKSPGSSKKNRTCGGSNLMPVIEGLLLSSDSWFEVESTKEYQYPGVFSEQVEASEPNAIQTPPRMGHVSNIQKLPHFTGENHHLLYCENQLSKGNYNDNLREVTINGEKQNVRICYAACKGVLECSVASCNFAASKAAKKCPNHPTAEMIPSGSCPVYVVYVYPQNHTENGERWITGITKDSVLNSMTNNLHNHPLPKPSKVPNIVHESVKQAVRCNPSITPSQLNLGNGIINKH